MDDIVKLHSARAAAEAIAVMEVLGVAAIKYTVTQPTGNGNGHDKRVSAPDETIDIYISREDLDKADELLRPLLSK